jgi:hypothetical protein
MNLLERGDRMNYNSVAPCGVICDICLGFQREKNKCVGCNKDGNKPYHCTNCSIKSCSEKNGNSKELCSKCSKYPCTRIKSLNKRYEIKYGESIISNFAMIDEIGIKQFIEKQSKKYKCHECGNLVCVHKEKCLICGAINTNYPLNNRTKK